MRLYTNIRQGNVGVIHSRPVWLFDFRLEVMTDEANLIQTYQLQDRTLGRFVSNEGTEGSINVAQAWRGCKDYCFFNLGQIYGFRQSLLEGCESLRAYLRQILEIRAGGAQQVFDVPLFDAPPRPAPPVAPIGRGEGAPPIPEQKPPAQSGG